ncbi:alpha/beta-hydrolase [Phlegmacium glaucopus]|nr:alpha/beta-hydrolase [Phlegmacium glaucopus]
MLEDRSVDVSEPGSSEDCLFLKLVSTFLEMWEKTRTFRLLSGYLVYLQLETSNLIFVRGGYVVGNASLYNGNDLLREAGGGVVAVFIQYRLGVFGFLPGEKVKESGALNAGLLDQQVALQWVRKYISKFGGDPDLVTIWGESAGAGSVLQHVIANDGNTRPPLFRAAITSSTFLPSQYHYNDPISEALYDEVVNQTNNPHLSHLLFVTCFCQSRLQR